LPSSYNTNVAEARQFDRQRINYSQPFHLKNR
jgi:hypothetical protein